MIDVSVVADTLAMMLDEQEEYFNTWLTFSDLSYIFEYQFSDRDIPESSYRWKEMAVNAIILTEDILGLCVEVPLDEAECPEVRAALETIWQCDFNWGEVSPFTVFEAVEMAVKRTLIEAIENLDPFKLWCEAHNLKVTQP